MTSLNTIEHLKRVMAKAQMWALPVVMLVALVAIMTVVPARADDPEDHVIGKAPDCTRGSMNLQENQELTNAIFNANAAHALAASLNAQAVANQNPPLDLSKCLDLFNGAFSLIDLLMAPLNLIFTAIIGLLTSIIQQACTAVMTTIQNLLNSICIPLPPFDFGLSKIFGVQGKPCNGLSLGNVLDGLGGFGSVGGGMSPWDLSTLNNYSPQAIAREIARGRIDPVTGQVRR